MTFGGANGVTLVAGGAVVVTDTIVFALDETKDYIVAFNHGSTSDVRVASGAGAGYTYYEKAATSGGSGNITVSGYSAGSAGLLIAIDKVEVVTVKPDQ